MSRIFGLKLLSFKEINVKYYLFPFVSEFFLQKHAETELNHTTRVVRKPGVSDTGLGTGWQRQESSVCSRHRSRWQRDCAGDLRSAGCWHGLWYQVSLIIFYPLLLLHLTTTRTEAAGLSPDPACTRTVCNSAWIIAADSTVSSFPGAQQQRVLLYCHLSTYPCAERTFQEDGVTGYSITQLFLEEPRWGNPKLVATHCTPYR